MQIIMIFFFLFFQLFVLFFIYGNSNELFSTDYDFFYFRLCAETQTNDFEDDEDDFTVDHKSVNGWFRRIMRFALPVQFFLMVMLFFAWNSTDHHHGFFHGGCNGVSRFHFLYPELKYINGPPPI